MEGILRGRSIYLEKEGQLFFCGPLESPFSSISNRDLDQNFTKTFLFLRFKRGVLPGPAPDTTAVLQFSMQTRLFIVTVQGFVYTIFFITD